MRECCNQYDSKFCPECGSLIVISDDKVGLRILSLFKMRLKAAEKTLATKLSGEPGSTRRAQADYARRAVDLNRKYVEWVQSKLTSPAPDQSAIADRQSEMPGEAA